MIHSALSKSEIAFRYYQLVKPDKDYTKGKARVQFQQDRKLDKRIIRQIVYDIFEEQKQMLND